MNNDQTTQTPQDAPVFQILKIYTKDVSFENPNAPEIFLGGEGEPNVEMHLDVANQQAGEETWEVTINVSLLAREKGTERVIFEVEVEQAGLFLIRNVPQEMLPPALAVDCPTILFPYLRQTVSQLIVDGGFMPVLLEPINFAAAYQQSLEHQAASETKH
jgi:preprotein translocase subunit SecB